MTKLYYSIATLTAFFCLSLITGDYESSDDAVKIQYIDMSDYPMYIVSEKGE